MPKLPSSLRAAYDVLLRGIQEAHAHAGTGQRTRRLLDGVYAFRQAVSSASAANTELQRRARFVADNTMHGTALHDAWVNARDLFHQRIIILDQFRVPATAAFYCAPPAEGYHLAETLSPLREDLRILVSQRELPEVAGLALEALDRAAQQVQCDAALIQADGAWYLTHPEWLKAVTQGRSFTSAKVVLEMAKDAAKLLMEWYEEELAETRPGLDESDAIQDRKSWTGVEVDTAIRRYKDKHKGRFDEWENRVAEGDSKACREARKVFGRNTIADALGIPRVSVSRSEVWRSIAQELGLEGGKTLRPAQERIGLDIALERLAERKKGSVVEEEGMNRELLEQIHNQFSKADDPRPGTKPMSRETRESLEALEEKLERGTITSDQANEIYHLIFDQSKDRGQHRVAGQP